MHSAKVGRRLVLAGPAAPDMAVRPGDERRGRMDTKRLLRHAPFLLVAGSLIILSLYLSSRGASAAPVQLKNDNNTAAGYNGAWRSGDIVGAVLTPESAMYPVRVLSVEFVLYQFAGADDSATVRVCIYSMHSGAPDTQLGCSTPTVITTFSPSFVSVSLASSEIVIQSPDSFMAAVEYAAGSAGTTPSTLTDSNTDIPQGKNYYSKDEGSTWYEHYDFWMQPDQVGFNIIRATVDTNYGVPTPTPTRLVEPTRTPTPAVPPTSTPTPLPPATPYPCSPPPSGHQLYLPLVLRKWQGIPGPPPEVDDVLGVKSYWSYASMMAGDHLLAVNLSTGNLLITYLDQDVPAPGIDSILVRTYNALGSYSGDFGHGWASNVGNAMRLKPRSDGSVVFFGPSGGSEVFTPQAGGFASPPGFHYTLTQDAGGSYALTSIAEGVTCGFDGQGRLTSVADRNGNTQSYHRDAAGDVVEIVDSVGQSTVVSYTTHGGARLVAAITDRAGRLSQYSYDADGRLTHHVNPAGHTTEYCYDACDDLTELVDAGGNSWTFGYDAQGRVVLVTGPLDDVTQFTYQDGATIVTDAGGHNTIYSYDAEGRLREQTDPNGHTTRFTWDQSHNLTNITSPLNHKTQLHWNGNTGLLASVSDALGNAVSYAYDANNNLTSITDGRGHITHFDYDPAGANMLRVTQADGSEVTFTYDGQGNPLTMVDPSGNAGDPSNPTGIPYSFAYNAYGYPTDAYDPLGNHWTYGWDDGAGNLLSMTDARGQLTQYTYDAMDRLTGVAYDDGTAVGLAYDALGGLTAMTDTHGTTVYTYDGAGQLRTEDGPRTAGAIQYGYDAVGNLISVTRENGHVLTFNYDPAGRLASQSNPFDGDQLITYMYDADDRLTDVVYPNGDQTSYTYYANGWLKSLLTTAADGTIYDRYRFPSQAQGGYDANGNPLEFTRSFAIFNAQGDLDWTTQTWEMQYDAMDRMIQQDGYDAGGTWQWRVTLSYNPNGLWANRTYQDGTLSQSWDYSYDAASRWTGISFWDGRRDSVTNDANGNQTQILEEFFAGTASASGMQLLPGLLNGPAASPRPDPAPGREKEGQLSASAVVTHTTTFEYDAADRLARVTDPAGNWYAFAYDGFDRLVEVNSSWFISPTYQYYDLLGMARETQGAAAVNYLYDLAGNVRANALEGFPAQYLHRDPRGQITHVSDDLLAYFDYCFMGNVQAGGVAAGGILYEPLLSTGLYAIPLDDTWQGGILYHIGAGQFWPHNSQLNNRNVPQEPSMRNAPPQGPPAVAAAGGGGWDGDDDGDGDDQDPKDPWWKRLFRRFWQWLRRGARSPWLLIRINWRTGRIEVFWGLSGPVGLWPGGKFPAQPHGHLVTNNWVWLDYFRPWNDYRNPWLNRTRGPDFRPKSFHFYW
jgi:YD repeat-containing protein